MNGPELTALRHQLNKTQEEMADFMGVSLIGYKRFESGYRPLPDYVARSAQMIDFCRVNLQSHSLAQFLEARPLVKS